MAAQPPDSPGLTSRHPLFEHDWPSSELSSSFVWPAGVLGGSTTPFIDTLTPSAVLFPQPPLASSTMALLTPSEQRFFDGFLDMMANDDINRHVLSTIDSAEIGPSSVHVTPDPIYPQSSVKNNGFAHSAYVDQQPSLPYYQSFTNAASQSTSSDALQYWIQQQMMHTPMPSSYPSLSSTHLESTSSSSSPLLTSTNVYSMSSTQNQSQIDYTALSSVPPIAATAQPMFELLQLPSGEMHLVPISSDHFIHDSTAALFRHNQYSNTIDNNSNASTSYCSYTNDLSRRLPPLFSYGSSSNVSSSSSSTSINMASTGPLVTTSQSYSPIHYAQEQPYSLSSTNNNSNSHIVSNTAFLSPTISTSLSTPTTIVTTNTSALTVCARSRSHYSYPSTLDISQPLPSTSYIDGKDTSLSLQILGTRKRSISEAQTPRNSIIMNSMEPINKSINVLTNSTPTHTRTTSNQHTHTFPISSSIKSKDREAETSKSTTVANHNKMMDKNYINGIELQSIISSPISTMSSRPQGSHKRSNHIQSEKRRRHTIRAGFQTLVQLVPMLRQTAERVSKTNVSTTTTTVDTSIVMMKNLNGNSFSNDGEEDAPTSDHDEQIIGGHTVSKATILIKSVEFIEYLLRRVQHYEEQVNELERQMTLKEPHQSLSDTCINNHSQEYDSLSDIGDEEDEIDEEETPTSFTTLNRSRQHMIQSSTIRRNSLNHVTAHENTSTLKTVTSFHDTPLSKHSLNS